MSVVSHLLLDEQAQGGGFVGGSQGGGDGQFGSPSAGGGDKASKVRDGRGLRLNRNKIWDGIPKCIHISINM